MRETNSEIFVGRKVTAPHSLLMRVDGLQKNGMYSVCNRFVDLKNFLTLFPEKFV